MSENRPYRGLAQSPGSESSPTTRCATGCTVRHAVFWLLGSIDILLAGTGVVSEVKAAVGIAYLTLCVVTIGRAWR